MMMIRVVVFMIRLEALVMDADYLNITGFLQLFGHVAGGYTGDRAAAGGQRRIRTVSRTGRPPLVAGPGARQLLARGVGRSMNAWMQPGGCIRIGKLHVRTCLQFIYLPAVQQVGVMALQGSVVAS
jgi:hypothetical protein